MAIITMTIMNIKSIITTAIMALIIIMAIITMTIMTIKVKGSFPHLRNIGHMVPATILLLTNCNLEGDMVSVMPANFRFPRRYSWNPF